MNHKFLKSSLLITCIAFNIASIKSEYHDFHVLQGSTGRKIPVENYISNQASQLFTWSKLPAQTRQNIVTRATDKIRANCTYNLVALDSCAAEEVLRATQAEVLRMYSSFCHAQGLSEYDTALIINLIDKDINHKINTLYGRNKLPHKFFDNYLNNMIYEIQRAQKNLGLIKKEPVQEQPAQRVASNKQAQDDAFILGALVGGFFGWFFGANQNSTPEPTPAPVTPSAPPYHAIAKRCNNCKKDVLPNQNNACPFCLLPFYA